MADVRDKSHPGKILKKQPLGYRGLVAASAIILCWAFTLWFLLIYGQQFPVWVQVFFVLIQTHLFTGIFITLHDSIHGTVAPGRKLNRVIGYICAKLFAFNNYSRLSRLHHLHHVHAADHGDPDFSENQHFWIWYFRFLKSYVDGWQILFMAIAFNILQFWFLPGALVLFWIVPSVLSTLQLFYFGTYLPHRHPEDLSPPARARSQRRNHILAFITCYFFGYHTEHHLAPYLPWWRLPAARERMEKSGHP